MESAPAASKHLASAMPSSSVVTLLRGRVTVLSRFMRVALLSRLSLSSTQSMRICTAKSTPHASLTLPIHSVTKRARFSMEPAPYSSVRVLW